MKKILLLLMLLQFPAFSQQNSISKKMQMAEWYNAKQTAVRQNKIISTQSAPYQVDSIGYAPYAEVGTPLLIGTDDLWSDSLLLAFNFCYFGNSFSKAVVGANGQITFDMTQKNNYDGWTISDTLPSTVDLPGNTICGPFRDIDPSVSGNTYYQIIGNSPNKIFIVSWSNIPLFDASSNCAGIPNSDFQIALHETSNTIEVFIHNSSACTGWNGGYGIIGIQDVTGSIGISPPNRNYPVTWTAVNEAWRFTPTSGSCFTTGINNDNKIQISVYPNPCNGVFTVKTKFYQDNFIEIYNSLGQKISIEKLKANLTEVDISDFSNGIYSVRIFSANGDIIYQSKIVKQ